MEGIKPRTEKNNRKQEERVAGKILKRARISCGC